MTAGKRRGGKEGVHLVIFDLDGTLVDAYAAVAASLNVVTTALGLPRTRKERVVRSVGWGERHLLSQFVPEEHLSRAVVMYRRHHAVALKTGAKLLPGARALLDQLSRDGYRLAVASNRAIRFTDLVLRHLDIARYFDGVLCRDQVRRPKPAPDMLRGLLRRLACPGERAVFVGDMTVDLECGRRAGIRAIGVSTGSHPVRALRGARPYAVVSRLHQLREVIERMDGSGENFRG